MNIFVIPSWYPTADYPLNGSFTREQTVALCRYAPELNVGVSLWGKKERQYLLWANEPLQNIKKLLQADTTARQITVLPNLTEYTKPTFTWTRRFRKGNFARVVQANYDNLKKFEAAFGPADIIHAHVGYPAGRVAMELSKKLHLPYVLTEHMGPFPSHYDADENSNLMPYYKQAYLHAAVNVAVSTSLAETMQLMGLPNIRVIPNFVDEEVFIPVQRETKAAPGPEFFTLAEIRPLKGIDLLLHAIKMMTSSGKKAQFRIGGDGPYLQEYKQLAQNLGIENYITWLGALTRAEAVAEYQQCDAFVLPSRHESMGVVYVEALACGKPIIATKCGGPETIVNSQNGLLVEIDDVEELANALLHMVTNLHNYNPVLIRQDFLKRFSKKAVLPQIINLYKVILQPKKSLN